MTRVDRSIPEVSVVMSVFNGAPYLKEAVESVLNQEHVDFEFIIVNDGSTDDSGSVLDEFARNDSRIRLFHRANKGLTSSLIFGCQQARAAFIARQDSDDVSLPRRLSNQLRLLSSTEDFAMVSCHTRYIGPDGEHLNVVLRPACPEDATRRLMNDREGPPAHGSVMFRKSMYFAAGGYREQFYYGQDSDLWLRLCRDAQIAYVPETLYEFRLSPNSISTGKRDLQKVFGQLGQRCHQARSEDQPEDVWLNAAAQFSEQVRNGTTVRSSERKIRANASYFIGSTLLANRHSSAAQHLRDAIGRNPLHWQAWLKLLKCWISQRVRATGSPNRESAL